MNNSYTIIIIRYSKARNRELRKAACILPLCHPARQLLISRYILWFRTLKRPVANRFELVLPRKRAKYPPFWSCMSKRAEKDPGGFCSSRHGNRRSRAKRKGRIHLGRRSSGGDRGGRWRGYAQVGVVGWISVGGCQRREKKRQMVGVDPDVGSSEFSKFPQPECTCPPHSVTPCCSTGPI